VDHILPVRTSNLRIKESTRNPYQVYVIRVPGSKIYPRSKQNITHEMVRKINVNRVEKNTPWPISNVYRIYSVPSYAVLRETSESMSPLESEINVTLPSNEDFVNTVKYGFGGINNLLLPFLSPIIPPEHGSSSVDFSLT
jgi:hypothetical protein